MVVSRRLLYKSVCTSPTRLKNLSEDVEVAGTVRYCLALRTKSGNFCWYCFHHIRGCCSFHVSWMESGKSHHPMKNSRLLFLVHLSFTTSTKQYDSVVSSWRFERVDTVPCHTRFPTCGVLTHTFCTRVGFRLFTHRFPTRIMRGSPDLFAFVTSPVFVFFKNACPLHERF
jgi:hypothetical protein